jgi:hypothetical protein
MADHELNIIVAAKGALAAARSLGRVTTAVGGIARNSRALGTAGGIWIDRAASKIVDGATRGIESLAELEDATTSVQAAITQMGLGGQVNAQQVATWANDIERDIGAAFDDKEIVQATTTLIRFGKTAPQNIRPAMQIITDLATKTGDVDSAATLLAKALADPTKAAGKLARQGIVLSKAQQETIKEMVEQNRVADAQAVILDEVAKTTEGAASASQGKYRRSLSVLADVTEDAQRALGEGFLPVIERVSDILGKEIAKPSTLKAIREFGTGIAGGLDVVIDVAQKLPWSTIGDSLRIAGSGARAVLDAFLGLPPWVQTAVITGWGLNKLTGGALGGVIGELGKGLVKGVLGMNAGVVNIKAGVVNGAGGGVGGATGGRGLMGKLGTGLSVLGAATGVIAAFETQQQVSGQSSQHASEVHGTLNAMLASNPSLTDMQTSLRAVNDGIRAIQSNPLHTLVQGSALDELRSMRTQLSASIVKEQATTNAVDNARSIASRENSSTQNLVRAQTAANAANSIAQVFGTARAALAATNAGQAAATATANSASRIVAAIYAARPVIQSTTVQKTTTINNRYGETGGSRQSDWSPTH